jgi:hypothetical protein
MSRARPGSPSPMRLRRNSKSKKRRAAEAVGTYLKFKAISKFVKSAPTAVKALPLVAGVGAAGAVAARKRRNSSPSPA